MIAAFVRFYLTPSVKHWRALRALAMAKLPARRPRKRKEPANGQ